MSFQDIADVRRMSSSKLDTLEWDVTPDAYQRLRVVMAELRAGGEIPLVTEASMAAEAGAGYNRNDLLMETGWTATIGVGIAKWAGATFDNQILG